MSLHTGDIYKCGFRDVIIAGYTESFILCDVHLLQIGISIVCSPLHDTTCYLLLLCILLLTCLSPNILLTCAVGRATYCMSLTGLLLILCCSSSSRHSEVSQYWALSVWVPRCLLENTHSLSGSELRCDFFLLLNVPSTPSLSLSPGRATAIN